MRRTRSARLTALIALGVALTPLAPGGARAGWPPPENATAKDMADPANWPNDPGYGYSATEDGQWNYYSFIPDVAHPRPEETASGMSIDLAWRLSIGDDSVRIVITDSGIEWDHQDLLDKAWLNDKELANHKPTHADGSACGGEGALAGFDCNGDGIFAVSDYAETPTLSPEPSEGHPRGDKNNNGVLDAGDLILNFSDGVDDDANGYVDDISGWDFMKDDNDPYDDTRYGHGTGEAGDSVAATNNMRGEAGVCPKCRFIPTRVGDSFITDVSIFGKAVVYAADNDAKIVQCALGTINMNRFAQAALDYAYDKGTLVVASMADENSRHHNVPAAANHTLPVHAIEYDGNDITSSTTFFAFHPCSNYGGQNFLSASGNSCSSEATGRLSGIVGLLYSYAKELAIDPPLLPGEVHSIFFTTTDDIDVPESRVPDSNYRWSQPGFDQRFGYGRVNANRALEALRDRKIPPAVDITSPTWFSILYKDQVKEPIALHGTISAKRAGSYDYVVEWAPGVQPLDSEFKAVKPEVKNVDASMVIGADGSPLAMIDLGAIDPKHERDVDSPRGENDTTITVRVRATAHYGGAVGDVRGELRRTYYVQSDPTLVKGFPIYLGDSGEGSPKMVDLDGDGVRDLLYPSGGGLLHAYKLGASGPSELPGFPFETALEDGFADPPPTPQTPLYTSAPAYALGKVATTLGREPILGAPAIDDLDGDGQPEIVFSTWSGTIYVIDAKGKTMAGWPKRLPLIPSCSLDPSAPPVTPCMSQETRIARGAFASPVLADMDKDGKLDIIQAAFDGKVHVFHADGSEVSGWPVEVHYTGKLSEEPQRNRVLTTPAVADFDGDGYPELLVGSNERLGSGGQSGALYLLDGRGSKAGALTLPNWPIAVTSLHLFPLVAEGVPNSGVIGNFEGQLAGVMHGNATLPLILPRDPGKQTKIGETPTGAIPRVDDPNHPGQTQVGVAPSSIFGSLSTAQQPNTMLPLFAQPSLGDLDQDGVPEVIASGGSLNLAIGLQSSGSNAAPGDNLLAMWSGKTGAMMPGSPMVLDDFTFFNSQAVVDLSGDDYPEVITGSGGYFVHAFDACGREPEGFPKFTGQWIGTTPAVGDLDGDKKLELVVGTRDGWLYAWHTEATESSIIEWESFHHDNHNSGNLETPLAQGGKQKAKTPLVEAMCKAPEPKGPVVVEAMGGCTCTVGEEGNAGRGAPVALGLLALSWMVRRRRDASAGSLSPARCNRR
jgi:MYXO-CTERM domain-containing protein